MGAWPTDDLTSTHLNSGSDDPALARAELYALLTKVQSILAAYDDDSGVAPLDSSGYLPKGNLLIPYAAGMILHDGTYSRGPSGWSCSKTSTGTYKITHNWNDSQYIPMATSQTTAYTVTCHWADQDPNDVTFKVTNTQTNLLIDGSFWFVLFNTPSSSYTY